MLANRFLCSELRVLVSTAREHSLEGYSDPAREPEGACAELWMHCDMRHTLCMLVTPCHHALQPETVSWAMRVRCEGKTALK